MLDYWIGFDTVELIAPMPRERCVAILRARVHDERTADPTLVVGEVGDASLSLRWGQDQFHGGAAFRPVLYAELRDAGMRTHILCRTAPSLRPTMVFGTWASLGGALLMAILHATSAQYSSRDLTPAVILAIIGLAFAMFGRLPRGSGSTLLTFLRDTLGAVPAPGTE